MTANNCKSSLHTLIPKTSLNKDVNGIIAEYAMTPAIQWRIGDLVRDRTGSNEPDGRTFRSTAGELGYLSSVHSLEQSATKWSIAVDEQISLQICCAQFDCNYFTHLAPVAWTLAIGPMPGQITTFAIDLASKTISVTRDGMSLQTIKWSGDAGDVPSRCYAQICVWGGRTATLTFSYASVFLSLLSIARRCPTWKP